MKREIKFRVWDHEVKNMIYPYETPDKAHHSFHMLYGSLRYQNYQNGFGTANIMQYTGLKDKNGKGIYEGDVIIQKHWNGGDNYTEPSETHEFYGVVMWHCGGFGIQTQICRGAGVEVNVCENDEYTEVEIIGNIYEDEHLLNKRKR